MQPATAGKNLPSRKEKQIFNGHSAVQALI
jgi:hypothetical protein